MSSDGHYLHVFLRMKKESEDFQDFYEVVDPGTIITKSHVNSSTLKNMKDSAMVKKKYDFSKLFGPTTTQLEVFSEAVVPKLSKFIQGENCTVMSYGASGSGKTFTILGTVIEPGILPRSLEYIFHAIPKLEKHPRMKPLPDGRVIRLTKKEMLTEIELKRTLSISSSEIDRNDQIFNYRSMQSRLNLDGIEITGTLQSKPEIWISFAEIYNEHIHDLLQQDKPRGRTKIPLKLGNSNGRTYIKNLSDIHVTSVLEAFDVLQYGLRNLNYARTKIHDHSSRSHSIFSIKLIRTGVNGKTFRNHFNFCDLAGSERSKKTLNVGERLKESNNINTSLLVLGRCIAGVRQVQKDQDYRVIPFRESKLTQLFQNALSGHEDVSMIVTINPNKDFFAETQHVLDFSAIAKEIEVIPEQIVPSGREDSLKGDVEENNLKNQINNSVLLTSQEIDQEKFANLYSDMEEKARDEIISETLFCIESDVKLYLSSLIDGFSRDEEDTELSEEKINNHFEKYSVHSVYTETSTFEPAYEKQWMTFWKRKAIAQEDTIEEHHKTITALQSEIMRLRLRNQRSITEFNKEIRKQALIIKELQKQIFDMT